MCAFAVGQRRDMAATAVERRGVCIALACRAFGISETCYRHSPILSGENEENADLQIGLTEARKTWRGYAFASSQCQGHGWNHERAYRMTTRSQLSQRPLGTLLRNALPGSRSSPASD